MIFRFLIIMGFLFAGCSNEEVAPVAPIELNKDHACTICGMIPVEYPGPKAQTHYNNGDIDTFCCTLHMFMTYLQPEHPRNIAAIYVHDMGKADWDHPKNYWIDAKKAIYVYGGDKMGPMGEALVPFSAIEDAQIYTKDHGGNIFRFEDITMDMLSPAKHNPPLQQMGK
jgi:copper chaperone NosL